MGIESISERFTFDGEAVKEAVIRVVGVGGGGGNAVNNMIEQGINGVEFIAINTDAQALYLNAAPIKIQAGRSLTKGLGAGARAQIGAEAVEESQSEIEQAIKGSDMVFITAGMGGGTGTGGAPVVAAAARKMGLLSVAIVTKPFDCEGKKRLQAAEEGIAALRTQVDTLIVIPNERLLDIAEPNTTLTDAFSMADEVLYNATKGISDLITVHGLINLDFADVKTTMQNGGTALMGSATASGEKRAETAAISALSSPLLDGLSIRGARNVLVNITAGNNLGIREATSATSIVQEAAGDDVEVIFGTVLSEEMGENLRVTVIATGFDAEQRPAVVPKQIKTVQATSPLMGHPPPPENVSVNRQTNDVARTEEPRQPEAAPEPLPEPVVENDNVFEVLYEDEIPAAEKKTFRLTTKLDDSGQILYKGEDNVRALDEPAFKRRVIERQKEQPKPVNRRTVIRQMNPEKRTPRPPDLDEPAFLRNMMD